MRVNGVRLFVDVFSSFGDIGWVVFYDHRGNGRSEGDDPADWNLAQWADDEKALCDALGIVEHDPIAPMALRAVGGGALASW